MTKTAAVRTSTAVADPDTPANVLKPNADGSINVQGGGAGGSTVVTGNVAAGAADSGNPVKIGGVFNTAPATLANGQRGDLQLDNGGRALARLVASGVAGTPGTSNTLGLVFDHNGGNRLLGIAEHIFNGTTWDPLVKANATGRLPSSAASVNNTLVKNAAGNLYAVTGLNSNAAVRYLKLYNKATAPVAGTDVPFFTFALPAQAAFNIPVSDLGVYFSAGIGFALTTGAADNDTGAVGAGDILGLNIIYA